MATDTRRLPENSFARVRNLHGQHLAIKRIARVVSNNHLETSGSGFIGQLEFRSVI
jgi:hypothetical protein